MAGIVTRNGTTYNIKGGKTLINGAVYSIKNGNTLVNGTVRSISFTNSGASFTMSVSVTYVLMRGIIATIYINNVQKNQLISEYYEEDKNNTNITIPVNAGDSVKIVLASKITSASLVQMASTTVSRLEGVSLNNKIITGIVPNNNCYVSFQCEGS